MTDAVSLLNEKIDRAIMAAARPQFLKVARIIADVATDFGRRDDEFLERIAARIEALVASRGLEAAGDISKWRQSEIRLSV